MHTMKGPTLPHHRDEAIYTEKAEQGSKAYKEFLAIGLTIVVLLVCMPSSSMSGSRVLESSTATVTMLASSALSEDFLFCTEPHVGKAMDDFARLDVWYQCAGPVYDEFGYELFKFVDTTQRQRVPSWGHRPTALPAHSKVLVFGNSHTRQIGQTLACQYADHVVRVEHLEPTDSPDINMAIRVTFRNHAQLYLVANSYVAHSPHWQRLLEEQIGLSLSKLNAIVLGLFNPGSKHWETDFVNTMLTMQAVRPTSDEINVQTNYGPSVADVAAVYNGPVLFVTLFGKQEPARTAWARNQVTELSRSGRYNVMFKDARAYIETMGAEGASASRLETQDAMSVDIVQQAHRCTGVHGGHADLVTWDVAEFLFAQIGGGAVQAKRLQH